MYKKAAVLMALFAGLSAAELPHPYDSIRVLSEYDFGYYGNSNAIAKIFEENAIHVVVEVGSWIGGGSTKHMGELLRKSNGILYAVDTWLGTETQQVGEEHYQPVLEQVYQQFLSNMIHWNLTDIVIPCRMKGTEAAQALDVVPDLIYIDGEHTTKAVLADLCAWFPLVKEGGIVCGDDWTWPSVREAVVQFASSQNLRVESQDNFWRLHKQ